MNYREAGIIFIWFDLRESPFCQPVNNAFDRRDIHGRSSSQQVLRTRTQLVKPYQSGELSWGYRLYHMPSKNGQVALCRLSKKVANLVIKNVGIVQFALLASCVG